MCVLMIILHRKNLPVIIIVTACYMTSGQQAVIAGMNFYVIRLVILVGWTRVILKNEYSSFVKQPLDSAIIAWFVSRTIIYTILMGNKGAFINRIGFGYELIGVYFFLRMVIRSEDDIFNIIKKYAFCIIPLSLIFFYETRSGFNMFSMFGGVPEHTIVRHGELRCQGPFRFPILAGTFGAVSCPLVMTLWFKDKNNKLLCIMACIATVIITYASGSSGPLLAFIFSIISLMTWPFRHNMKNVRWLIVLGIVILALFMDAPVYYIFARLSGIVGGTGWHRSELIHQFVTHFSEWFLIGTSYTVHWGLITLESNPNMVDITNWYIGEAVNGGLITLIIFIYIIVKSYKILGAVLKKIDDSCFSKKIMVWCLAAVLGTHMVSFLSVIYFDQTIIFWYLLLAIIASYSQIYNLKEQKKGA